MYIPYEVGIFALGFIAFPIFACVVYQIGLHKGWLKEEEIESKGEVKNEKVEKKKQNKRGFRLPPKK